MRLVLDWDGVAPTPVPIHEMLRACEEILAGKELEGSDRTTVLLRKADAEYYAEEDARSAETASDILKADPNNFEALWRLGRAHGQCGKLADASDIAKKLVKLRPDSPYGYYLAGCCLNESLRHSEAISHFDNCVSKDKLFARAYIMRAAAQLKLGNFEASIKDVEKAILLPPTQYDDRGSCYFIRGMALQELGRYPEAVADFIQAKKIRPSQIHVNKTIDHMLWNCYSYQGKHGAASKMSEEILKRDPGDAHSHVARSRSLAQFGFLEESEKEARVAVKLAPKNPESWTALAIVQELRGDYPSAARAYFKSSELGVNYDQIMRFVFFTSTAPNDQCRSGKAARSVAEVHFSSFKSPEQRRLAQIVFSMVQAECGEFKKAAETVDGAAKIEPTDEVVSKRCAKLKDLYLSERPYRHDSRKPADQIFSLEPGIVIAVPTSQRQLRIAPPKK